MIGGLIDWCVRNRAMVVLLTAFAIAGGVWSSYHIAIDAIPDLSDVQVIIRTEFPGQAPRIVEDQVTYPMTTAMLAVPYAKTVRGYSMFGTSFVYVIFEDGTDLYWARSRVLEQLNVVRAQLPAEAMPQIGPDATGIGWVYQYVLVTGPYCPDHPDGLWHDPRDDTWFAKRDEAPEDARPRLILHRIFPERKTCPLTGKPLAPCEQDLADLRSQQDWYLRYELTAVEGVSEVAPIGGFVKQYQVVADPVKLLAYGVPLGRIRQAVRDSNVDVGGRVIEMSETEYMLRGIGYLGTLTPEELAEAKRSGADVDELRTGKVLAQLRRVSLGASIEGKPVYLGDLADIRVGPDIRRGILDWNGEGETVGGIVVMRFGGNARETIAAVKDRLADLEQGLPPGVAVRSGYDRADLIVRSIDTLRNTLLEELTIVAVITLLFLMHARSAFVALFVLPTGVLLSVTTMHVFGINANIMSLGGIAIAIGVMVDSSIVMVENAHKHLEAEAQRIADGDAPRGRVAVITEAAREVGPSLFFSLLVIVASFLPVFALSDQAGRLFKPLAWTKTFAMAAAAFLSVTVIPVLMVYFVRERTLPRGGAWRRWLRWSVYVAAILLPAVLLAVVPLPRLDAYRWWIAAGWVVISAAILLPQRIAPEERLWISRLMIRIYDPLFALTLRLRWAVLALAVIAVAATWYPITHIGREFMPPLEEGDLLYMPTTDPGLSVTKARELIQQTDKLIKQFPEVDTVFGKIGRAETATDPAPITMIETTITLHRDKSRWRHVPVERFFSGWPGWMREPLSVVWPTTRPITLDELIYGYELPVAGPDGQPVRVPGMDEAVRFPGLPPLWTQPIETRIVMLATGIRSPIGVKVMGPDLQTLSDVAGRISTTLQTDPRTREHTASAYADKAVGGNYLDIRINREEIARHGLSVRDVQDVIMSAMGGMNIATTVEGQQRYPISVRYPQELRDDMPALRRTLVATPTGAQLPLEQLADFELRKGPPMLKSENARLTSWVYVDVKDIDIGTYVGRAREVVAERIDLPPGYTLRWSGQFEQMEAANRRLTIIIPLAGVLIILLLYLATLSWLRVALVLCIIPLSLVGSFWLLWALEYDMSVAVVVGLIALAGLEVETGLIMLLYLDDSFRRFERRGMMRSLDDLWDAVYDGAVKRIRPKTMTEITTFAGLLPLLWAEGAGADTMRRLAAPMVGGVASGYIAVTIVLPALYFVARAAGLRWRRRGEAARRA